MPLPGQAPRRPSPGRRVTPASGRYAAGQLLALVLLALLAMPFLPVLVLVVLWLRWRDRVPR